MRSAARGVAVVVPFVPARLEPDTVAAVGPGARLVDVSADDTAYWRLLRDLWAARRTFILVEHDIVPAAGVLDAMRACDHDWCGAEYPVGTIWGVFHGCTRYGAAVIRRNPEAVRSIPEQHRGWQSLDSLVIAYLNRREPHGPAVHWPAAEHRNDARAPLAGVYANCGDCGGPLRFADLREGPGAERCPRCGRAPSYHKPPPPRPPQRRRNPLASKLIYVGNGRYINGVPAADFETDDADLIAQAIEAGLYVEVKPKPPAKPPAPPAPAEPAAAPTNSQVESAQPASVAPPEGDNQGASVA